MWYIKNLQSADHRIRSWWHHQAQDGLWPLAPVFVWSHTVIPNCFWRRSKSGSGLKNTKKCWLYWSVYSWTEADAVLPRACTGEQNGFFNHIIAIQVDKAKNRIQFSGASAKKKISDGSSSALWYKAFDWRNSPWCRVWESKLFFQAI